MTAEERLRRWKRELRRLQLNPRQIAGKIGVNAQTAYNWNCGGQPIPPRRLLQVENLK